MLLDIIKKFATSPSILTKDSDNLLKLAAMMSNIDIVQYHAQFVNEDGKQIKIPAKESVLAVNTEMDLMWQLECHLITKYKMKTPQEIHIKGSLTKI